MIIIDFSDSKTKAFLHGFSKGMAAPLMLFGKFEAPPLSDAHQIAPPALNEEQALTKDWKTIGADFNKVIEDYGKETSHIQE